MVRSRPFLLKVRQSCFQIGSNVAILPTERSAELIVNWLLFFQSFRLAPFLGERFHESHEGLEILNTVKKFFW